MSISSKLKKVKEDFINDLIPLEELLLYVEPLLMQAIKGADDEARIKKIVNGIEKSIYTQIEPQRTDVIIDLIAKGILFVSELEGEV